MKGRKTVLKPFPRVEADDESKNRYLAKLTRVQCRLRMQKMVELSSSLWVGRRVRAAQGKEASGKAKVRVEKEKVGKTDREREREREKRSLSARSSEKASVQRQGANEIVGYVLSTTA